MAGCSVVMQRGTFDIFLMNVLISCLRIPIGCGQIFLQKMLLSMMRQDFSVSKHFSVSHFCFLFECFMYFRGKEDFRNIVRVILFSQYVHNVLTCTVAHKGHIDFFVASY